MPLSPEDDFGFSAPQHVRTRRAAGLCLPRNLIGRTLLDVPREKESEATPRFNGIRDLVRLAASRRQKRVSSDVKEDGAATPATPASSSREAKANAKSSSSNKYAVGNMMESHLDELVFDHDIDQSGHTDDFAEQQEAQWQRRLKRPVKGADGKVITNQKTSISFERPRLHHVEYTPAEQKHPLAGSKRQFAWIHRPTAWQNPDTYEEPVEPGKRPSHPVSSNGVVATERKRCFPEKTVATGIPPAHMSKAPTGNSWGGWARCGAPGRGYMTSPWEVEPRDRELKDGEEAEFRVSDARIRRIPDMGCSDTSWLTTWHCDLQHDGEPPKQNKYSLGMPIKAYSSTTEEIVCTTAAGKSSNLQAEGCRLSYYDQVRMMDEARSMTPMPLTAR